MDSDLLPEDKDKIGFYILHNATTDETYVGSGKLGECEYRHRYLLESGRLEKINSNGIPIRHHSWKLQRAYNKDSNFNFLPIPIDDFTTLEENRSEALSVEQSIIDEFKYSPLLLNIAHNVTAPMTGFQHTLETNEKNRKNTTARWQDSEYRKKTIAAQNRGRDSLSKEEKIKNGKNVSKGLLDYYSKIEHSPTLGQKRTTEFCENNSAKIINKWKDPEYIAKQQQGRIGKMIGPNKKSVTVDDVVYDSLTAAAKAHGVTKQCAMYRANAQSFTNWK